MSRVKRKVKKQSDQEEQSSKRFRKLTPRPFIGYILSTVYLRKHPDGIGLRLGKNDNGQLVVKGVSNILEEEIGDKIRVDDIIIAVNNFDSANYPPEKVCQ